MDRGSWRAQVHGVTKSWIQQKQLSTQFCEVAIIFIIQMRILRFREVKIVCLRFYS